MKIQMQTKNNPSFSSSYQFSTPAGKAGSATLVSISEALKDHVVTSLKSSNNRTGRLRISCSERTDGLIWDILSKIIGDLRRKGTDIDVFCKSGAHSKTVPELREMTFRQDEEIFARHSYF